MRKHVHKFFAASIFLCILCLCMSNASVNAQIDVAEIKMEHRMQASQLIENVQWVQQALRMNAQIESGYFGKQIENDPVAVAAYRALRDNVDQLKTGTTSIPFTVDMKITQDIFSEITASVQKARDAFDRDYSEVFWLDSSKLGFKVEALPPDGSTTKITFQVSGKFTNYFQDGYQNEQQVEQDITSINQAISGIINSLSGTDYDKIKKIHDYLIDKNEYNGSSSPSEKAWEISSALYYGSTEKSNIDNPVCEGYARAFKVLCDKLNIPCVLVSGDGVSGGTREPHMWNYVQLDGAWYAVDVTWDDPTYRYTPTAEDRLKNQYTYFLKGSNNFPGHVNDGKMSAKGYNFSYPLLSPTDYVPQSSSQAKTDAEKVAEAKQAVEKALQSFTVTNNITEAELTTAVNQALGSTGVAATISGFQKTNATSSIAGLVKGTITLQSGNATDTVSINLSIAKLNQTDAEKIAAVKQLVTNALQNMTVTNNTTSTDLTNAINNVLRNTGVTATISGFQKTNATERATGVITGTIELQSGSASDSFALYLTVFLITSNSTDKLGNVKVASVINSVRDEVTATITESNIMDVVNQFIRAGKNVKGSMITLDVETANTVQSTQTRLPLTVQNSLLSHAVQGVTIQTTSAGITFDLNALQSIRDQARTDVNISMKKVDLQSWPTTVKTGILNRPSYDFRMTALNSNQSIHTFGTGKVWISIPYTPQRVDENGKPDSGGTLEQISGIKGTYVNDMGSVSFVQGSYYDTVQKAVIVPVDHFSSIYGVGYTLATDVPNITNEPKKKSVPIFFVTHTMKVGSSYQLQMTQLKDATMMVKSSNPSVASVTNAGLIKGKKAGTTTITYTVEQNQTVFTYKLKLTVKKNVGKTYNLKVSALQDVSSSEYPVLHAYREVSSRKNIKFGLGTLPKGAKVTYKSSNSNIALVNGKGIITGKKAGISVITATVKLDGATYYYREYVKVSDGKTKVYTSKYLK